MLFVDAVCIYKVTTFYRWPDYVAERKFGQKKAFPG